MFNAYRRKNFINKENNKLFLAAENGDIDKVKECIANGADIHQNKNIAFEMTPLEVAVDNCHLDMVKFLIRRGADYKDVYTMPSSKQCRDVNAYLHSLQQHNNLLN